jgi:NADH-quinone oxidoreductase subunit J
MVQVTVYAGAIMVLFLFVIMLLGAEKAAKGKDLPWQGSVAAILSGILIFEFGYIIFKQQQGLLPTIETVSESFGSPASIGDMLFNRYLVPFEVTSILLLVAMVGAILLTRSEREKDS